MKKEYDLKSMRERPAKTVEGADKVAMSIRLDAITVAEIKNEAARMGIPYQTLINSILHRFVTGELVDSKNGRLGA